MDKKKCKYCINEGTLCNDKFIGYKCTRKYGHKGEHVACGFNEHVIIKWKIKPKQKVTALSKKD
jgi:dTDP-4-dehydrorhamnose 3,5-epimerase-like enzyme